VELLNTTLGSRAFRSLLLSLPLLAASVVVMPVPTANAATSPTLGAAGSYSVLGHTTVTNTGPTTMTGDLGVSPGTAVTGFPPGVVGPPGTIHAADANAADAQLANTAAFGFIDQSCTLTFAGTKDLAGSTLGPGVYCADAFSLAASPPLTLTGSGVWIFKSAADINTSPGSSVVGGDPCNVWWRAVSSVTLGTTTSFIGSILASTSITLKTGATLNGRALAQTGQVALDSNTITGSTCLTPNTGGPTTTTTTTTGGGSGGGGGGGGSGGGTGGGAAAAVLAGPRFSG
jgi:Ice-binding-like